jgi:hypothetical protein
MTTDLPAQKRLNKTAPQQSDAKGAIGKSTAEYLMERYGPLLSANDLAEVLRFSGTLALDRSIQRGHLSLKTFHMQGRRGVFAHANDVAAYIAKQMEAADTSTDDEQDSQSSSSQSSRPGKGA